MGRLGSSRANCLHRVHNSGTSASFPLFLDDLPWPSPRLINERLSYLSQCKNHERRVWRGCCTATPWQCRSCGNSYNLLTHTWVPSACLSTPVLHFSPHSSLFREEACGNAIRGLWHPPVSNGSSYWGAQEMIKGRQGSK